MTISDTTCARAARRDIFILAALGTARIGARVGSRGEMQVRHDPAEKMAVLCPRSVAEGEMSLDDRPDRDLENKLFQGRHMLSGD